MAGERNGPPPSFWCTVVVLLAASRTAAAVILMVSWLSLEMTQDVFVLASKVLAVLLLHRISKSNRDRPRDQCQDDGYS